MLRLATGHRTTEIFDRGLNQWVWVDLQFSVLGAYLSEEGPINMAELHRFVNDPVRVRSLQVVSYDSAAKADRKQPLLECESRSSFFNCFKRDQKFYYTKVSR